MDYLQGLLTRTSVPLLTEPSPNAEQLENMLQAALRAPDHGNLKPFRFLTIQGEARQQLGELFLQRQLQLHPETDVFTQNKVMHMPLRAPLLLCLIACPSEHPKVPKLEQIQSAACAGQNILHACYAQGLGAVWRTGWLSEDMVIQSHLGITNTEILLGFIYLGTAKYSEKAVPVLNSQDFVQSWLEGN